MYLQKHWTQTSEEQKTYDMAKFLARFESKAENKKRNLGREVIREVDGDGDSTVLDLVTQAQRAQNDSMGKEQANEAHQLWAKSPAGLAWKERAGNARRMSYVNQPEGGSGGHQRRSIWETD
jgi:hypothetical protein